MSSIKSLLLGVILKNYVYFAGVEVLSQTKLDLQALLVDALCCRINI